MYISYVDKYISLGIKLAIYSIAMQGNKKWSENSELFGNTL